MLSLLFPTVDPLVDRAFFLDVVMCNTIAFLVSFLSNNCSFGYDPYWSVAPLGLLGFFCFHETQPVTARSMLLFVLVWFWSWRLTFNCCSKWKWPLPHEDWRYQNLRTSCGKLFWCVSFAGIHLMPTLLTFAGRFLPETFVCAFAKSHFVFSLW